MYVDGGPRLGICVRCRRAYQPTNDNQKFCKKVCRKRVQEQRDKPPIPCPYPRKLKYYSFHYAESRIGYLRRVHNNNRLHAFRCVCGDVHIGTPFSDSERLMNRKISKWALETNRGKINA